ncbi:hypothetical protein [Actinomadura rayongensis]|uniref:Uncharacterized protein n=1 Tax=Actinomadura rayongensis TaxID=1429076 RepID=A0A6I4W5Y6_9ACTN|nr:hypothetical protein [Actinomadura rayongensis]MXQ62564.1 hypothetical protein [Actinomadura rayongensis]
MTVREPSGQGVAAGRWGLVPWITAWSSEEALPRQVVVRGRGIGYADETRADRDVDGVLWGRNITSPGQGTPLFKAVHPVRQRRAMREVLCQVCGAPCRRDAVWLLSADEYAFGPWPAPIHTVQPPLCPECVAGPVRLCPHFRRGHVLVRARRFSLAGVGGMLYRRTPWGPRAVERTTVRYGDPEIRWMVAGQLITTLYEYTVARDE